MTRIGSPGRPALAIAGLAFLVAACVGIPTSATYPPAGVTPPPPGGATAAARQAITIAVGNAGLLVEESLRPYRPPEGAILAAAPRSVLRVGLPEDPGHGFITVYALPTADAARRAAEDQAAYVASNPGRVQFPTDAHFVVRVLDSAVIFYWWSPASSPDPRTPRVEEALRTIGTEVPVSA